ncbi:hypothetical protein D3C73_1100940 [compost metagenome]
MLSPQTTPRQGGIYHQRIISVDKGLFTARFTSGGSQTAKNDVDWIGDLCQRIGQLRIVRVKDANRIGERAARWSRNHMDPGLVQ